MAAYQVYSILVTASNYGKVLNYHEKVYVYVCVCVCVCVCVRACIRKRVRAHI